MKNKVLETIKKYNLIENRDKLDRVAQALLEKEVISAEEFQELIK